MLAKPTLAALALAAAAQVPAAYAAPPSATLGWVRLDGAEPCLAGPALAAAVEERVGRPVFAAPGVADLGVEGRAERLAGGWRATIRLSDRSGALLGDRVVESSAATCEELDRAVVTTLALMVAPAAEAPPAVDAPTPPEPPPPPRWEVRLEGSLQGGFGVVPGAAVGVRGAMVVKPPGFVPLVGHVEWVPFARTESGTTDFTRTVGGLQACPLDLRSGAFDLAGCLGVDVGAMFIVEGIEVQDASERVLVQAHAAVRPSYRVVGPLLLTGGLHLTVPLRTVDWLAENDSPLYTPSPIAGSLDLGLGIAL